MAEDKTLVVITGGTIEALYNPEEGTPYYVPVPKTASESCIPGALERLGVGTACEVYPLAMKDSKEVTTAMLDHVLAHAVTHGYKRIVMVHGTDTMPLHARYMQRRVAEWGSEGAVDEKTFIFTGAMQPLRDKHGAWREQADGWQNLTRALHDAQTQPAGVYVEMGEGPWFPNEIDKFVQAGDKTPGAIVEKSGFVHVAPERFIEHPFD